MNNLYIKKMQYIWSSNIKTFQTILKKEHRQSALLTMYHALTVFKYNTFSLTKKISILITGKITG